MTAQQKIGKFLLSLTDIDREALSLTNRKRDIEETRRQLQIELEQAEQSLAKTEKEVEQCEQARKEREHSLEEEETKIVERRKQLTAMGGAKAAKMMEREIEIASRALQNLEQSAGEATTQSELTQKKFDSLREKVEQLREAISNHEEQVGAIPDLDNGLDGLVKERTTVRSKLDERLVKIYDRVTVRYPGDAVAIVKNGACRSCYRSLPFQLHNQLNAGNNHLQCPGCSRMLVVGES